MTIWAAIAASCSAISAYYSAMINRRNFLEAHRPILWPTSFSVVTTNRRVEVKVLSIKNLGRGVALQVDRRLLRKGSEEAKRHRPDVRASVDLEENSLSVIEPGKVFSQAATDVFVLDFAFDRNSHHADLPHEESLVELTALDALGNLHVFQFDCLIMGNKVGSDDGNVRVNALRSFMISSRSLKARKRVRRVLGRLQPRNKGLQSRSLPE